MPAPVSLLQLSLIALSGLGAYLTWGLALNNGTLSMMERIREYGPQLLPGTDVPLKQSYTGIQAIDNQLTVLVLFFWQLVDGGMPGASLGTFRFASQFVPGWGLVVLESMRSGNKGRIISYVSLWGFLVQNVAWAVIMPTYLALYIATSPTVSATKGTIMVSYHETASLPLSLFAGFVVPAVMLALPAPSMQSFESKQTWLAIWQAFPIWVSAFQQVFKRCIDSVTPATSRKTTTNNRNMMRIVYGLLILFSGVTQIVTGTLTATSVLLPGLFAQQYAGVLNPSSAFIPAAATSSVKMPTIGSGAILFLQYDEAVGSIAVLIWATFMFASVYGKKQPFSHWAKLALGMTLLTTLTGPMGCSVALMWARDELVFDGKLQ
ncbi:hypothetical protein MMC11_007792 [Xylographa trunciseda]|nr:hypothetical protein [Xylographa trunciseda]